MEVEYEEASRQLVQYTVSMEVLVSPDLQMVVVPFAQVAVLVSASEAAHYSFYYLRYMHVWVQNSEIRFHCERDESGRGKGGWDG